MNTIDVVGLIGITIIITLLLLAVGGLISCQ